MTLDETLATLHPTQRATHPAGPLLLACGPGSGKTRILTHRIQWLVQQERVDPVAILALTFSRAAADELRGRLVRALGPLARELWAGTFHGFGAWLLRRHGARLGRTAAFTIFDREDTRRLIGRLVEELDLEGDLATLVEAVERAKGQAAPGAGPAAASRLGPLPALLAAYETRCREANAFDFADLLAAPLALFHQDAAVREGLRTRFRALLVDEAQDLCGLQHALVEALAAPDGAVTLAGDDDQAIYGWRGGDGWPSSTRWLWTRAAGGSRGTRRPPSSGAASIWSASSSSTAPSSTGRAAGSARTSRGFVSRGRRASMRHSSGRGRRASSGSQSSTTTSAPGGSPVSC
jgi:DNA helicase-2/ATP-dependent DNA helicase PcrA